MTNSKPLPDSWPEYEHAGKKRLRNEEAEDWTNLPDDAAAERAGKATCGADQELLHTANKLLAAELAASVSIPSPRARIRDRVAAIYARAAR